MRLRLPLPDPDRWNNLNTTTSLFLLNAVLTAFTGGVILGIVLVCGFRGETEISARAESIVNSWLLFLTSMWGLDVARFNVKRKTHQPGGSADTSPPAGRPSTAVPTEGGTA